MEEDQAHTSGEEVASTQDIDAALTVDQWFTSGRENLVLKCDVYHLQATGTAKTLAEKLFDHFHPPPDSSQTEDEAEKTRKDQPSAAEGVDDPLQQMNTIQQQGVQRELIDDGNTVPQQGDQRVLVDERYLDPNLEREIRDIRENSAREHGGTRSFPGSSADPRKRIEHRTNRVTSNVPSSSSDTPVTSPPVATQKRRRRRSKRKPKPNTPK